MKKIVNEGGSTLVVSYSWFANALRFVLFGGWILALVCFTWGLLSVVFSVAIFENGKPFDKNVLAGIAWALFTLVAVVFLGRTNAPSSQVESPYRSVRYFYKAVDAVGAVRYWHTLTILAMVPLVAAAVPNNYFSQYPFLFALVISPAIAFVVFGAVFEAAIDWYSKINELSLARNVVFRKKHFKSGFWDLVEDDLVLQRSGSIRALRKDAPLDLILFWTLLSALFENNPEKSRDIFDLVPKHFFQQGFGSGMGGYSNVLNKVLAYKPPLFRRRRKQNWPVFFLYLFFEKEQGRIDEVMNGEHLKTGSAQLTELGVRIGNKRKALRLSLGLHDSRPDFGKEIFKAIAWCYVAYLKSSQLQGVRAGEGEFQNIFQVFEDTASRKRAIENSVGYDAQVISELRKEPFFDQAVTSGRFSRQSVVQAIFPLYDHGVVSELIGSPQSDIKERAERAYEAFMVNRSIGEFDFNRSLIDITLALYGLD